MYKNAAHTVEKYCSSSYHCIGSVFANIPAATQDISSVMERFVIN